MNTSATSATFRGYVIPFAAENHCKVAFVAENEVYPILPKGAGVDLADMVSIQLEVKCTMHEDGDRQVLHVRSYKVLEEEEDAWLDDK